MVIEQGGDWRALSSQAIIPPCYGSRNGLPLAFFRPSQLIGRMAAYLTDRIFLSISCPFTAEQEEPEGGRQKVSSQPEPWLHAFFSHPRMGKVWMQQSFAPGLQQRTHSSFWAKDIVSSAIEPGLLALTHQQYELAQLSGRWKRLAHLFMINGASSPVESVLPMTKRSLRDEGRKKKKERERIQLNNCQPVEKPVLLPLHI
ncbi:hypothetical protein TEQG_02665 [Trichophyton equinum CBS 127.97]|uniref:Uncharacterized protein n=1 Tax=Trichophyton equinum (strain ATCC MYA-4606 / CBS 127.97) TaxID=559882 RepID=F2PP17_TRIEC|nr:hypothetical protein TEQG_02665 [Trichophyton equinum CBS 127.97]